MNDIPVPFADFPLHSDEDLSDLFGDLDDPTIDNTNGAIPNNPQHKFASAHLASLLKPSLSEPCPASHTNCLPRSAWRILDSIDLG